MMILAMDVVGDRSAYRHQPGSGRDRQAPTSLQHPLLNLPQEDAGSAAQNAGIGIESQQSIALAEIDQRSRRRHETTVAIASAIAAWENHTPLFRRQLVRRCKRYRTLFQLRIAAPTLVMI